MSHAVQCFLVDSNDNHGVMMSFTDGKPWRIEAKHLALRWGGRDPRRHPFRCYMCGHRFEVGDIARWIYTNDLDGAGGNPMICAECDGPDVRERWRAMCKLARTKFWWFTESAER